MTGKTGWQKGVRAAQEAKAAPEAMQHGLELSKARDRVPGGQGWLLTEAPWTVTEDAGGNSQFDFLCFCPSPGQVARQGDVKQHHFRLRCLLGNEVALPPFIPWAEQQTPVLPILALIWLSVVSAQGHSTGGLSLSQAAPSCQQLLARSLLQVMASFFWVVGSESSRVTLPTSHIKYIIWN